jgi:hypothetical protein
MPSIYDLPVERRLQLLVEAVVDYAIFLLDAEGRIASWNAGAQRIKGYSADEIIGSHFSIFYSSEQKTKSLKTLARCVAIGTVITLALFGLGYLSAALGGETLSYVLYWQAYLMYQMLPCDVVFRGEFMCQSMTAATLTFYAGIPVGIVVYSAAAWLALRLRRPATPSAA